MRFLILLLIVAFLSACSSDNVAGSTSVGNGFVEASLTFDGKPVSTNVMLVPSDYKPGIDSLINIKESVSSIEGIVKFDSLSEGEYSLVVIDSVEQFGIVKSGILPNFDNDTIIEIALGKLGTFAYYLPDSLSSKVVSITIEGTPIYFETSTFTQFENGIEQVLFNNMPMGDNLISTIEINDSTTVFMDTISIIEDDTTALAFNNIIINNIRPLWEFPLIVGVTSDMITTYGNLDSVKILIEEHLSRAVISLRQDVFNGYLSFPVDSMYVITGTLNDENKLPPEGFSYRLLYSPNEKSPFGGWNKENHVLVQDHGEMEVGGTFGDVSLIGLRWLLGSARGAYYVWYEEVSAASNPISSEEYIPKASIMSLKSSDRWMDYNVELINLNGLKLDSSTYASKLRSAETLQIILVDSTGALLEGAVVEAYGIVQYPKQVSEDLVFSDTCDASGTIEVQAPYLYLDKTAIAYSNILLKIDYDGKTAYSWLPYSEVSYKYLQTGDKVFNKQITFEP